ncbi:MAG: hypothetical protein CM15mP120_02340 [Pseudomonadota bacterium]|nr:MAG: hypothetical protein CM15mP120_02340 [Pseudomonadota bacterium]
MTGNSVSRVQRGTLQVAAELDTYSRASHPRYRRVCSRLLGWPRAVPTELGPVNKKLLALRDEFQNQLDEWHLQRKGQVIDAAEYKAFLQDIGYLLPEPESVTITTKNVDAEIASIAGHSW